MPEVLADLQARRDTRPVSPLAHRRVYRARKFLTRNRILVAVVAESALGLSAAVVRIAQQCAEARRQLALVYLVKAERS